MSEHLLPTKLYIPPQRPHLTPRPRLINKLNQEAGRKLTLIAAPAGFGKTTLVTAWLTANGVRRPAWLSLDENDNLYPRFFIYFIAAAQTVLPDFAQGLMSTLQSSQVPGQNAILSALMHELTALQRPLLLVLDDYHVIDNDAIHHALETLIEYMPPSLRLVMTSREAPPLPLPRWRVRGQLTEIGSADLRFTVEEAAVFLEQTMGIELDDTAVAALENRTEGWVAGLQLAALSLKGSQDTGEFIAEFGGSSRHVADYLLEEVLHRQSPQIQTFLLETAVLERFCGPLCDAVTGSGKQQNGRASAAAILEQLETGNLFLIPLDAHRRWYRYHHLFAELLQHRLRREREKEDIKQLHRRASAWFAGQELLDEAVHHAMAGEDDHEAARLLATITNDQLWDMGYIGMIKKWGAEISDAAYRRYPRAVMIVAASELVSGDFHHLYHHLELMAGIEAVRGEYSLFQSILVRNKGDFIRALHLAKEAGEFLDPEDSSTRAMALMQMAVNMFQIGELAEAEKAFSQARQLLEALSTQSTNTMLQIIHMQAFLHQERVDFHGAVQRLQDGLRMAERDRKAPAPMIGLMLAALGTIFYEWNELETAADYYDQARDWGDRSGISDIVIPSLLGDINLLCQRGEAEAVWPKFDKLQSLTGNSQLEDVISQMETLKARFHLRLGQVEQAIRWADNCGLTVSDQPETSPIYPLRFQYMTLVAVRLEQSRTLRNTDSIPPILKILDHLLKIAQKGGFRHTSIELMILQAMALELAQETAVAVQTMQHAIDMAEPGRLVRLFIDHGPPLLPLLARCDGEYANSLYLALLADLKVKGLETADPQSPPLDLTPREFAVLKAIVAGLSNKEIEEKLVISHNTVRTHIKNLYSKLDVTSRTQAVKKALDLRLV